MWTCFYYRLSYYENNLAKKEYQKYYEYNICYGYTYISILLSAVGTITSTSTSYVEAFMFFPGCTRVAPLYQLQRYIILNSFAFEKIWCFFIICRQNQSSKPVFAKGVHIFNFF